MRPVLLYNIYQRFSKHYFYCFFIFKSKSNVKNSRSKTERDKPILNGTATHPPGKKTPAHSGDGAKSKDKIKQKEKKSDKKVVDEVHEEMETEPATESEFQDEHMDDG